MVTVLCLQYLRYMMFVLETAVKNMKNGQEQWIWLLDLAGVLGTSASADASPTSTCA